MHLAHQLIRSCKLSLSVQASFLFHLAHTLMVEPALLNLFCHVDVDRFQLCSCSSVPVCDVVAAVQQLLCIQ